MIGRLWTLLMERKRRRYLALLQARGMRIGAGVTIEDGFFFDPSHCYLIEIGARCTLAPNVRLVAHDASTKRLLGATRLGRIVIEEDCFLGDSVLILPGVTVGKASIVGAGAVVSKSIPAGSLAAGNPARVLGTVEAYRQRQAQRLASGRRFPADYWVENATPAQLAELAGAVAIGAVFIE